MRTTVICDKNMGRTFERLLSNGMFEGCIAVEDLDGAKEFVAGHMAVARHVLP